MQGRFYVSLYLCITGFYLLTASGRMGIADSVAMFNVARSMATEHTLSSEPCEYFPADPSAGMSVGCVPGTNGRHYAGYGLLTSMVVVPAVLGGEIAGLVAHVNPLIASKAAVSIFTLLIAPLVCLVLAAWILKLGYSRRTAAAAACVLAFASPFWHFGVKGFFSEPYFTLALLLAACVVSSPRRKFACALAGLALGMACAIRPNGVILFPGFILCLAIHIRAYKLSLAQFVRDSLYFSTSFSACALLIAWANYARFGSPFKTGYHLAFPTASVMLATPFFRGLSRVLFSGEFGLLVFAPWVIVALVCFPRFVREHAAESALCGSIFLIYLLFFSKFAHTDGGWVAGPRYMVPTLPFLIAALVPALQYLRRPNIWNRRPGIVIAPALLLLVAAGVLIQSVGAMFPDERYYFLGEFYRYKSVQPWWAGSIPLASVDFLAKMSGPGTRPPSAAELDQLESRHESERAFATASSAATEEEFLGSFPNPSNMTSPNLMLLKFKPMGLPWLGFAYWATALAIGFSGLVGLRRHISAPELLRLKVVEGSPGHVHQGRQELSPEVDPSSAA